MHRYIFRQNTYIHKQTKMYLRRMKPERAAMVEELLLKISFYLCKCVYVRLCAPCICMCPQWLEEGIRSPGTALQVLFSHQWVLGANHRCSGKTANVLKCWAISPAPRRPFRVTWPNVSNTEKWELTGSSVGSKRWEQSWDSMRGGFSVSSTGLGLTFVVSVYLMKYASRGGKSPVSFSLCFGSS